MAVEDPPRNAVHWVPHSPWQRAQQREQSRARQPHLLRAVLFLALASLAIAQPNGVWSCPEVAGYDVLPSSNVVSTVGCDVGAASSASPSADTPDGGAMDCDTNPGCLGFAYHAELQLARLKTCTRPATRAEGVCLYTKLTRAGCPNVPGFAKAADRAWVAASEDGDVLVTNLVGVAAAAISCAANPACASINVVPSARNGTTRRTADAAVPVPGTCAYSKIVTPCPPISGYNLAVDHDHPGDNMGTPVTPASIALTALTTSAKACSQNPSCRAFNSLGQLKSIANPLIYTRGSCLYTKTPMLAAAGCPQVPGYAFTFDRDHSGNTLFSIAGWDPLDVVKECDSDTACKGFNSNGEGKTALPSFTVQRGTCFYTKLTTVCKPYLGYDTLIDMASADLPRNTLEDDAAAFQACEADPSCTSFDSLGNFHYGASSSVSQRGVCQYIKVVKNVCPDVAGYIAVPDSDIGGFHGSQLTSATAAKHVCDAQEDCLAYNSKGMLKLGDSPVMYSRNTCLYIKAPTFCPPVPGYTSQPDKSVPNAVLKDFTSLEEGTAFCAASSECQGVSKNGLIVQAEPTDLPVLYQRGSCFYWKGTTCPEVLGYEGTPGLEPAPATVRNTFAADDSIGSLQGALADCNSSPGCGGFSFGFDGSNYVAKTTLNASLPLEPSRYACFYNKTPTVCPDIGQGYAVETDSAVPDAVYWEGALAHLWLRCSANNLGGSGTTSGGSSKSRGCFGLTSDRRLDLTGSPRVYCHSVCYWYKKDFQLEPPFLYAVSLKKTAHASSAACDTTSGKCYNASLAVDGDATVDPDSRFQSEAAASDPAPWISIDLGDLHGIVRAEITTRRDCCGELLASGGGVQLYYTNSSVTNGLEALTVLGTKDITSGRTVLAASFTPPAGDEGSGGVEASSLGGQQQQRQQGLDAEGVWRPTAPGVARWVILYKKNRPYQANVSLAVQEITMYGLKIPAYFRDDFSGRANFRSARRRAQRPTRQPQKQQQQQQEEQDQEQGGSPGASPSLARARAAVPQWQQGVCSERSYI